MTMGIPFFKNTVCLFVLSIFLFPVSGFADVVDETLKGDDKLAQGQIPAAEEHYTTALKMDPESWRIMRSLADVKFRLEKFEEADKLTRRILAMKVANRNIVIVTVEGDPAPFEADIVDDSGIAPDDGSN
ncbi:MAG: tetratricopeptide repeat protein, partial [Deltaproteobacteria bacterium]|nr:tetratricopeptide repeat protein [Deltaproteobacteria bacterium]